MKNPLSLTDQELGAHMASLGQPAYRARQVIEWIYQRRAGSFSEMSSLPAPLRERLEQEWTLRPLDCVRTEGSRDTTQKFLFRLPDGQFIESVLIPASPALYGEDSDRRTLCVSTQVGCAYGCKFCASGLDGWKRNLEPGEIVAQFLEAERLGAQKINNIVFMGMGEPLANYDSMLKAVSILNAPWGPGIGARHITISTSGLAPRIRDLAAQPLQIRLAISLHGATDAVRSQIMPVNRKYPLEELLAACGEFCRAKKQFITFEFILIAGVNDSDEQASALARLAGRLRAKINLIPCNAVEGLPWERPTPARQDRFLRILRAQNVPATIRREKGHDIAAACGQLRLRQEREKNFALSQPLH